jgi:anti-sigma factor RsiW
MMECQDVKKLLAGKSDGSFSTEEVQAMEQHAGHCESCAALMAGYRVLDEAIAARKAIAPKPFAATRILQAIEKRENTRKRHAVAVLRPVLITLALLVALMAGFLIGNAGYSRIAAPETPASASVESLKSDLFIQDFVDEDIILVAYN